MRRDWLVRKLGAILMMESSAPVLVAATPGPSCAYVNGHRLCDDERAVEIGCSLARSYLKSVNDEEPSYAAICRLLESWGVKLTLRDLAREAREAALISRAEVM